MLLITIDTLRADAVGAYGRPGGPTPWIDRVAAGGVRFTNAYAHNVVTLPSHANILTGRLPTTHGVRDNAGFRLPPTYETLATVLRRNGYRTGAFVSAFPLESRFGLDQGFEVYDDRFADAGPRPAFLIQERRAVDTVAAAAKWIDRAGGGPWFCWVHLYEPHFRYEPPEPFLSRWPSEPYLGEVAAADAALAPLVAPILEAGAEGRTLVVLTSDHGESLGEHGEATHGIFAYEPALKVPLVIYGPRILRPGLVDAVAQHVDLMPTVLDAVAVSRSDGDGGSLLPSIADASPPDAPAVYFEALSASMNRGWAPLTGVIDGGHKYIELPIPELYDLRSDPREERNLAASDASRVANMRAELERFRSSTPMLRQRESPDVRERLRSLGYVTASGGQAEGYTADDDPKRLITLDTLLHNVLERYLSGDLDGALARARELVHQRPTMALSWIYLAHLEREAGNPGAAVEALRRATALNAGDVEPLMLLGAYLTEAGRAPEAVKLLSEPAGETDADIDLLAVYALALSRVNRGADALAVLGRARAEDPSNATLLVHEGTVQLTAGDRAAARAAFEAAIRHNPALARAHSSLGVLAVEEGRVDQAYEHWKTAGRLDPDEYGRVLAMGVAFARQGRNDAARACLQFFAAHAPPARYAPDLDRARAWLTEQAAEKFPPDGKW